MTDKISIDFIPPTTQQRVEFGSLLTSELIMRGLSLSGPLSQRVSLLKERLVAKKQVTVLLDSINHKKPDPDQLYDLIMAIPCILHLEMRV